MDVIFLSDGLVAIIILSFDDSFAIAIVVVDFGEASGPNGATVATADFHEFLLLVHDV